MCNNNIGWYSMCAVRCMRLASQWPCLLLGEITMPYESAVMIMVVDMLIGRSTRRLSSGVKAVEPLCFMEEH